MERLEGVSSHGVVHECMNSEAEGYKVTRKGRAGIRGGVGVLVLFCVIRIAFPPRPFSSTMNTALQKVNGSCGELHLDFSEDACP